MATQVQTEQFNMFQTTSDQVNMNSPIFFAIPGFKERFNEFGIYLQQLFQLNEERNTDGSGASKKLIQSRQKLVNTAYSISSKVTAYALSAGNQTLLNEMNYTKSDLKKSSYQNLVSQGEVIHKRALGLMTELTGYHVTQAMLDDFRTLLDDCRKSIPAARESINKKASSGKSMNQLIKANLLLLDDMDTLAEVIRDSDPTIYEAYKKARKIVGLPTHRKAVVGTITNAGGTEALKGASIVFYLNGDTMKAASAANGTEKPVLTKKTAKKGGFRVNSLPEGMYRVEVIKTGYQTQVLTVAISASETTKLVVKMEKDKY